MLAETPRENGTAALHHAGDFLLEALRAAGAEATLVPFTATPYALRLAGVIALAAGILYFRLARAERFGARDADPDNPETGARDQYQVYQVIYASGEEAGAPGRTDAAAGRRTAVEDGYSGGSS